MSDDLTARDIIARSRLELDPWVGELPAWALGYAGEVLAALAAAGYTIVTTDDWEWASGS